jgi:hypothetical protein
MGQVTFGLKIYEYVRRLVEAVEKLADAIEHIAHYDGYEEDDE